MERFLLDQGFLARDFADELSSSVTDGIVAVCPVRSKGACEGMVKLSADTLIALAGVGVPLALCNGGRLGLIHAQHGSDSEVFVAERRDIVCGGMWPRACSFRFCGKVNAHVLRAHRVRHFKFAAFANYCCQVFLLVRFSGRLGLDVRYGAPQVRVYIVHSCLELPASVGPFCKQAAREN